jgi:large subunit ribosomal protein L4
VRDHAHDLPRRVRQLALRHALSAKAAAGAIRVLDKAHVENGKTRTLVGQLDRLGWTSALIIDAAEPALELRNAARNIPKIDVLPVVGINVYDILRRDTLVLTRAAVDALEARFA